MSGPAVPAGPPPVLATVRVRMYQVGFGDCFLLSFEYAGAAEPARHMLIDFGSRRLAAGLDLPGIATEIDAVTGGGPDVVVLSHRHQDHMSGFGGSGTEAVVSRWQPRLVVRSWMRREAGSASFVYQRAGREKARIVARTPSSGSWWTRNRSSPDSGCPGSVP